ncbi:MAG: hypothetical protein IJ184_06860 [Alphaproteobacteria bacterium]|nr:hypothetical protein [Alphaproteobacteria bacterium]
MTKLFSFSLDFRRLCLVFCVILLALGVCITSAEASILFTIRSRAATAINEFKYIAYCLGGFGLVGLAWGCIWGKINWKWFGSLAIGLFLISWMGMLIDYFTDRSQTNLSAQVAFKPTGISASEFGDTLKVDGTSQNSTVNEVNKNLPQEITEEEYEKLQAEESKAQSQTADKEAAQTQNESEAKQSKS